MNNREKKFKEHVELLVNTAHLNAVTFTTPGANPILEDFMRVLSLKHIDDFTNLDFFMTVAGVGIAFMLIKFQFKKSQGEKIAVLIKEALDNWHPRAYSALTNLLDFISHQPTIKDKNGRDVSLQYAIGNWVIYNMKNDIPSKEEMTYSFVIGGSLLKLFGSYWQGLIEAKPNE